MTRLGVALGAHKDTFMGLAGLGDLVLTCTDNQSRNRRCGLALAAGTTAADAQKTIGQVVEGVQAARAVRDVATRLSVEMPICEQVYRVVYEGAHPKDAVKELMGRAHRNPSRSGSARPTESLSAATLHRRRLRQRSTGSGCGCPAASESAGAAAADIPRAPLAAGRVSPARTRTHRRRRIARCRTGVVPRVADREPARPADALHAFRKALPDLHVRELLIVQARAAHGLLVDVEAERRDQVQARAGVGAQADHVAGVRRDLGLVQDDVKHRLGG